MRYNKLVRDKIPNIIMSKGSKAVIHKAGGKEYWIKLRTKLQEEVNEFLEESNKEELSDILEVIYAICDFKKINKKELEEIRRKKEKDRGSFGKRLILEEVKNG